MDNLNTQSEGLSIDNLQLTNNDLHPEFDADYELELSNDGLDSLELRLTKEEEQQMQELLELRNNAQVKPTLFKDMLEAAKQGALNYLNSFTDTGDTFDEQKNPSDVRKFNDSTISIKDNSATPHEPLKTRTIDDARSNPFDLNVAGNLDAMNDAGKVRFAKYKEAYAQRTKSLTNLSVDGNTVERSNSSVNFETLSGLRGYRVGPVVPVPTVKEAQDGYKSYKEEKTSIGTSNSTLPESTWLYNQNMNAFDDHLVKEFGFKSRNQATQWRKENNLTVHEGPDGMFLVPRDVHDKASHNGYRTKMTEAMEGKISQAELDSYVRKEKIEFVKHEAKTRSVRAIKGVGMSIVRDLLKNFIFIIGEEAYKEFNRETDESFIDRIKSLIKNTWIHLKEKCHKILTEFWDTIKKGVKGALLSEFFTLLNDFVFKTAKNFFKIIRTMWSSVYKAIKVIFSSESSWGERIFEATKIITAGFVGVVGFSLNELLDKGLTSIGIPFSSFIAECLSGLFAGVMSSLVLVVFDNIKDKIFSTSPYIQMSLIQQRMVAIDCSRISISSLRINYDVKDTWMFVGTKISEINEIRKDIDAMHTEGVNGNIALKKESDNQTSNIQKLKDLSSRYLNDSDF